MRIVAGVPPVLPAWETRQSHIEGIRSILHYSPPVTGSRTTLRAWPQRHTERRPLLQEVAVRDTGSHADRAGLDRSSAARQSDVVLAVVAVTTNSLEWITLASNVTRERSLGRPANRLIRPPSAASVTATACAWGRGSPARVIHRAPLRRPEAFTVYLAPGGGQSPPDRGGAHRLQAPGRAAGSTSSMTGRP